MDKQYSDAEQYSKYDRDHHDADNARILFLDYGFTAEQIKRISETGYVFDWEGDARTDVRYCINHDLLPHSEKQRRAIKWASGAADIERAKHTEVYSIGLVNQPINTECRVLDEDREGVQIAIAKFATDVALGWMVIPKNPSPLDKFRANLNEANCKDIEETITRILEAIQ